MTRLIYTAAWAAVICIAVFCTAWLTFHTIPAEMEFRQTIYERVK